MDMQDGDFGTDTDQILDRWERDPWGRENTQGPTYEVECRKNLEDAMHRQGFSRVRSQKMAYWMSHCHGQFVDYDTVVRKFRLRGKGQGRSGPKPQNQDEKLPQNLNQSSTEEADIEDQSSSSSVDVERGFGDEENRELRTKTRHAMGNKLRDLGILKRNADTSKSAADNAPTAQALPSARKMQKVKAMECRELDTYIKQDYLQAARRFDVVYGSAEELYALANEKKAARLARKEQRHNCPTTQVMLNGEMVEAEDPSFGLYVPPPEERLTQTERIRRDKENKQHLLSRAKQQQVESLEARALVNDTIAFN